MMNFDSINRLSRPKLGVYHIYQSKYTIKHDSDGNIVANQEEEQKEKQKKNRTRNKTEHELRNARNEIEQITNRVTRPFKRHTHPPLSRGTPKTLNDLESFINRMSTPKRVSERGINRSVAIEREKKLTTKDIHSLCDRLADSKYARKRTPDTRRLLDRTYSPVNTYAWQGIAHNNIDWRFYSPHSMGRTSRESTTPDSISSQSSGERSLHSG